MSNAGGYYQEGRNLDLRLFFVASFSRAVNRVLDARTLKTASDHVGDLGCKSQPPQLAESVWSSGHMHSTIQITSTTQAEDGGRSAKSGGLLLASDGSLSHISATLGWPPAGGRHTGFQCPGRLRPRIFPQKKQLSNNVKQPD